MLDFDIFFPDDEYTDEKLMIDIDKMFVFVGESLDGDLVLKNFSLEDYLKLKIEALAKPESKKKLDAFEKKMKSYFETHKTSVSIDKNFGDVLNSLIDDIENMKASNRLIGYNGKINEFDDFMNFCSNISEYLVKDVSQSCNLFEVAEVIQRLNSDAVIKVLNPKYDNRDVNQILYSSLSIDKLCLPAGFEIVESDDGKYISNKHNTKSGRYFYFDVKDLKEADETKLMPIKPEETEKENEESEKIDEPDESKKVEERAKKNEELKAVFGELPDEKKLRRFKLIKSEKDEKRYKQDIVTIRNFISKLSLGIGGLFVFATLVGGNFPASYFIGSLIAVPALAFITSNALTSDKVVNFLKGHRKNKKHNSEDEKKSNTKKVDPKSKKDIYSILENMEKISEIKAESKKSFDDKSFMLDGEDKTDSDILPDDETKTETKVSYKPKHLSKSDSRKSTSESMTSKNEMLNEEEQLKKVNEEIKKITALKQRLETRKSETKEERRQFYEDLIHKYDSILRSKKTKQSYLTLAMQLKKLKNVRKEIERHKEQMKNAVEDEYNHESSRKK